VKSCIFGVLALAGVLLCSVCVAADDAKAKPGDNAAAGAAAAGASDRPASARGQARSLRLTKPWRDMSSLTDEQKKQIAEIHRKAVQDKKVVDDREKADIMALLNDPQKAELKGLQDKEAADRKAKAGSKPETKTSAAGEDSSSSTRSNETDRASKASDNARKGAAGEKAADGKAGG
jgi:hypothetical protein